jgi:hypothetical protein
VYLAMNHLEGPQRNCADLYIEPKKMIHGIDSAHGINIFHAGTKCCVLRFSIPLLPRNSDCVVAGRAEAGAGVSAPGYKFPAGKDAPQRVWTPLTNSVFHETHRRHHKAVQT